MSNEITLHESIESSNLGFLRVNSISEAMQVGEMIKQSGFAPPKMTVIDIVLAIQMGLELGLKPLQALQNISVVNGRPSLWGDGMIALCKQHPDWEWAQETFDSVTQTAKCVIKRRGQPEVIQEYSVEKAKRANLWGKAGPWQQYPERMLQLRARGFALRDAFPDALKGLISTEEARDYPAREDLSKEKAYTVEAHSVPVDHVNEESLKILLGYMAAHETSQDIIKKWLDITRVEKLRDLPEAFVQKLIKRFMEKEEQLMHIELEQNQQDRDYLDEHGH